MLDSCSCFVGNVLKELCEPAGAVIYCSRFKRGDPTLSVLELWGAEYQESNAMLIRQSDRSFLERVCQREKCPVDFVGNITGDGKVKMGRNHNSMTFLSFYHTPFLWGVSDIDNGLSPCVDSACG